MIDYWILGYPISRQTHLGYRWDTAKLSNNAVVVNMRFLQHPIRMRFRFSPFWVWDHPPLVYSLMLDTEKNSHPWNSPAAFGQNKRRREELLLLQVSSLEIQLFSSVGRPVTDTGGPIPERVLRDFCWGRFFSSFYYYTLAIQLVGM